MKRALASIAIVMLVAAGCQNGKKSSTNPSVMQLNQPAAPVAYAPPSPVPAPSAQPVVYDAPPATAAPAAAAPAAPEAAATGGKKYKVQKGDTLYSLAKSHYGSGKQFTKIVAANPGLSAETLKAGQTITIP